MTDDLFLKILLIIMTATTGFGFWNLQRKITRRDAERDSQEEERRKQEEARNEARKKHELFLVKGMGALMALSEATACAVKDGHCNGEMTTALKYAQRIKHEQKDFLNEQGVENLL